MFEEALETTFAIVVGIPVQIIPAHLIHHDPNDELWPFDPRRLFWVAGGQDE
jgi:hypothetical protein